MLVACRAGLVALLLLNVPAGPVPRVLASRAGLLLLGTPMVKTAAGPEVGEARTAGPAPVVVAKMAGWSLSVLLLVKKPARPRPEFLASTAAPEPLGRDLRAG